jgi:hypothetical protein
MEPPFFSSEMVFSGRCTLEIYFYLLFIYIEVRERWGKVRGDGRVEASILIV